MQVMLLLMLALLIAFATGVLMRSTMVAVVSFLIMCVAISGEENVSVDQEEVPVTTAVAREPSIVSASAFRLNDSPQSLPISVMM